MNENRKEKETTTGKYFRVDQGKNNKQKVPQVKLTNFPIKIKMDTKDIPIGQIFLHETKQNQRLYAWLANMFLAHE